MSEAPASASPALDAETTRWENLTATAAGLVHGACEAALRAGPEVLAHALRDGSAGVVVGAWLGPPPGAAPGGLDYAGNASDVAEVREDAAYPKEVQILLANGTSYPLEPQADRYAFLESDRPVSDALLETAEWTDPEGKGIDSLVDATAEVWPAVQQSLAATKELAEKGTLEDTFAELEKCLEAASAGGGVIPDLALDPAYKDASQWLCGSNGYNATTNECNAVGGTDVVTNVYVNACLGFLCLVGFGLLRTTIKVYRGRLLSPQTAVKPDPLPGKSWRQGWDWIVPVLAEPEIDMLESAGLDAVMMLRILMLCAQVFTPAAVLFCAVLIPINKWSRDYNVANCANPSPDQTLQLSISNVCNGSPILWVHFFFVYVFLAWAGFILYQHYKTYVKLRHWHISCYSSVNQWQAKYLTDSRGISADAYLNPPDAASPASARGPAARPAGRKLGFAAMAAQWIKPDKFLDREGEEVAKFKEREQIAAFFEQGITLNRSEDLDGTLVDVPPDDGGDGPLPPVAEASREEDPALRAPRPEAAPSVSTFRIADDSLQASMRGAGSAGSVGSLEMVSLGSHRSEDELMKSGSLAAHKWWDLNRGSLKEDALIARPSVRHIKWINTMADELQVAVKAEHYAVLVMDVPHAEGAGRGVAHSGPFRILRKVGRAAVAAAAPESKGYATTASGVQGSVAARAVRESDSRSESKSSLGTGRVGTLDGDVAAEAFAKVFPNSYQETIVVRDFRSVTRALYKWDSAAQKLERFQAREKITGEKMYVKTGFLGLCGEQVAAVPYYEELVKELSADVKAARRASGEGEPSPSRFVLFSAQDSAAIASQTSLFSVDGNLFKTQKAPGPDDIYWPTILMTKRERQVRHFVLAVPTVLLMLVPAGVFSGATAAINSVLCGAAGSKVYWEWYCDEETALAQLFKKLIVGWLPPILLTVWQIVVMRVLYYIACAEGRSISLSQIDRRIGSLYFYWDFFNVFLGATLGASIFVLAQMLISLAPLKDILSLLGASLNTSSNFFIQYVSLRGLCMIWLKLVWPHPAVLMWTLRKLLAKFVCAKRCNLTFREEFTVWAPKSFMYGKELGIMLLIALMGIELAITAPLVLPFTALYFLFGYLVYKHHLLYVYSRSYESGGEFWVLFFDRMCIMLGTMTIFTAAQLFAKVAILQAILMVLTGPLAVYVFWGHCQRKFLAQVEQVPLEVARKMPTATVPRELYIAPEQRKGSMGWHPEAGKAWVGYGVPMWTL